MRNKYFFLLLFFQILTNTAFADPAATSYNPVRITWPINRTVFQRNSNNPGTANVWIGGTCPGGDPNSDASIKIQYRIITLSYLDGTAQDSPNFQDIPSSSIYQVSSVGGQKSSYFRFVLNDKPQGWYSIEVIFLKSGNQIGVTSTITFGVGDVYFIAGQSNAMGYYDSDDAGLIKYYSGYSDIPDAVNIYNRNVIDNNTTNLGTIRVGFPITFTNLPTNGKRIFPLGVDSWCYAAFARDVLRGTDPSFPKVPIAFFNCAAQQSSISDWYNSLDGLDATTNFKGQAGYPYITFQNTLQMFGSVMGVRSILWHQGESDGEKNTTDYNYYKQQLYTLNGINGIIKYSRSRFNSVNKLSWYISKVGYYSAAPNYVPAIKTALQDAQVYVAGAEDGNKLGAQSDDINESYRAPGKKIHFSDGGLKLLSDRWITAKPWEGSPILGNALIGINVAFNPTSGTNGQYTVSVPGGYATYVWIKSTPTDEGSFSNPYSTNSSIVVDGTHTTTDLYTCYVSTSNDPATMNWQVCLPFNPQVGISTSTHLIISNGSFSVGNGATSVSSTITLDSGTWSSNSDSWLHMNQTTGNSGTTNVSISVDANLGSQRTGTVTISGAGETKTISITQSSGNSGCAETYLSSLTPSGTVVQGWGSLHNNSSVIGNTITINGQTYQYGLGTHAVSDIQYALNSQYTAFHAWVGRDDETDANHGNCNCGSQQQQFIVKVDGSIVYDSGVFGFGAAREVNVSVAGKNSLELIVYDGDGNIWGDHVDWADAKLLCSTPPPTPTPTNCSQKYLSDLTAVYTQDWGNLQNDQTVNGNGTQMSMNGVTYSKGIGTHAYSNVKYTLNGTYSRFKSTVGLDGESNTCTTCGQSVLFVVNADGTNLYTSPSYMGINQTDNIDISVAGKNTLELIVYYGNGHNWADHVDWATTTGNFQLTCPTSQMRQTAPNEEPEKNEFSIYPNPTDDKLTVKFYLSSTQNVTFSVVDIQGKLLNSYQYSGEAGNHTFIMDVSKLSSGNYILNGIFENQRHTKKFIVGK